MQKEDSSFFNKELGKIKFSSSFDETVTKFNELCQKYISKYLRYIKTISEKAEYSAVFQIIPRSEKSSIYYKPSRKY